MESIQLESAARVAESAGLRGMGAIIVQVAEEIQAILVTLDDEVADKSQEIVTIKEIKVI